MIENGGRILPSYQKTVTGGALAQLRELVLDDRPVGHCTSVLPMLMARRPPVGQVERPEGGVHEVARHVAERAGAEVPPPRHLKGR
jgi:hypothetical protein